MSKKENQNIEYKESWHDDYLKWVAGFCNANGGKIYIGVNDKGEYVGLKNITAYRDLNELVKLKYVVKEGTNKQLTNYKLIKQ